MGPSLSTERLLAIIKTQNQIAATALDLEAVMSLVVDLAQGLTGAEAAVVELADGEEMVYHVGRGSAAANIGVRLRIDSSLSGTCLREGRTLHCADAAKDDRVDAEACRRVGARSMVCVPLAHASTTVGVLKVYDPRANAFGDEDVATLDLLSGVIGAHMAHASEFEERHHDSRHDQLTGLPNRRAFEELLAAELARAGRHGGRFSVCLLDLDRFKRVNDQDGHAVGDEVLRAVAQHLRDHRGEDGAFRFGGDEFALLLVEADGAGAVVSRIGAAISTDPRCRGVGASWGVADYGAGDDAAAIVARADAALYEMKRPLGV